MLDWIGDQILHILNYVPELFLAKDTLRWWFAFVFVVVLALIFSMARKAFRSFGHMT